MGPDGALNRNALQAARSGAHSVEAIDDLDEETERKTKDLLEELSREGFEGNVGE